MQNISNEPPFVPNLDPGKEDDDEFGSVSPAEQQHTEEILDDMQLEYCKRCNGTAFLIHFGKKIPCPYGVKKLRSTFNTVVCYSADQPAD